MKTKGIICNNCGAEIDNFTSLETECPYCGGIVKNETFGKNNKKEYTPNRVIPFILTEKEVVEHLLNALVDTDYVPMDIFEKFSVKNKKRIFIPMYRYNGTINVSWSCTVVYRKERKVGDKTEYYDDYHPASGNANKGFNILCLAIDDNVLPQEMKTFIHLIKYVSLYSDNSVQYEKWKLHNVDKENAQILWTDKGEHGVWDENPKRYLYLDTLAWDAARTQVPYNSKDLKRNWSCSSTKGELILVPFWIIDYSYEGQDFCYVIDGVGNKSGYSNPIDDKEKDCVKQIEEDKKKRIKEISGKSASVIWPTLAFLFIAFATYGDNSVVSILIAIFSVVSSIFFAIRFGREKTAVKNVAKYKTKTIKSTAKYKRMMGKSQLCGEPIPENPLKEDSLITYANTSLDRVYISISFLILIFLTFLSLFSLLKDEFSSYNKSNNVDVVQIESTTEENSFVKEIKSQKNEDSILVDKIMPTTTSIDLKKNVKITPQFTERVKKYEELGTYSEGLALAKRNKKWGYIDVEGNEVIPCQFDGEIRGGHGHSFSDGLAIIYKNGKHGYINQTGDIVIDAIYDEVGDFSEGIACVQKHNGDNLIFIDKQGQVIKHLSDKFTWDWSLDRKLPKFRNGVCRVHVLRPKGERYEGNFVDVIWINTNAEQVSPPFITEEENEDLELYWSEENGVSKMGYKDKQSNIVIPAKYSSIGDFSHGVAVASLKYGMKAMSGATTDGYIAIYGYVDMNGNDTFTNEDFKRIEDAYKNKPKDEWW